VRPPALGSCPEDALLAVQERDTTAPEGEASIEAADVGHVLAELRTEDGE
jgi:hypothetical protein